MYFSDFLRRAQIGLNKYGAFDISLLADLPLFVDPFLLFNSKTGFVSLGVSRVGLCVDRTGPNAEP